MARIRKSESHWIEYEFTRKEFCEKLGIPLSARIVTVSTGVIGERITVTTTDKS